MTRRIEWPHQKEFAFTIFDDTDNAKLEDVRLVYDFLLDLGIRTTKSVWVLDPQEKPRIGGANWRDQEYLDYCLELADRGAEIALHNVSAGHNLRKESFEGFERFENLIGSPPRSFANHADNRENIYWGEKRLSGLYKKMFRRLSGNSGFEGEKEDSPFFWGDICKKNIQYVRNFVFEELNTLKADRFTPYHDSKKPYVNRWFSSANANDVNTFNQNITRESLDKLEREKGYSIVYTHFCSFVKNGQLDASFAETMKYLSSRPGWFVPVSDLLDYVEEQRGEVSLTSFQRFKIESKWFSEQIIKQIKQRIS